MLLRAAIVLGASLRGLTGCTDAEEFRAAATDSLHSGLSSIASGLLDGLFAVVTPDDTSDTSTTTTGG